MKIYFIRHGESQANRLHQISNRGLCHGLTRAGREQVLALAGRLANRGITHIYASPVLRAIETGILLADRLNLDYEIVDALREYDCGLLEGRSDEASWQQWHELYTAWTVRRDWGQRLEGGESFFDLRNRFVPFIQTLIDQFGDRDAQVACVSHGGVYRMMLPLLFADLDADLFEQRGLGYAACLVAELRPDGWHCVEWDGFPFS